MLTGSTNFTVTGVGRNLNHVIVLHYPRICQGYLEEFTEIRQGVFGQLNRDRPSRPRAYNLNGVPVRALFAPDHAPELELIKQMLKCQERLDFAIFTFAGSSGIDDAMVALRSAGRRIVGVLDPAQGAQWWAATHWLHDQGIELCFPDRARLPGLNKLHHKLMVIDDAVVIAGSMNYTEPANRYNDENIVVIGSPYVDLPEDEGGPVDVEECAAIAGFFRGEVERIVCLGRAAAAA